MPVLADMEAALRADAPQLHEFGNVLRHLKIVHGDPDAEAEVWVEGYYETGMQDQAALGPEGGLAIPAEDGGIDLHVATQWLHVDRQQIAPCLGLPEEKVRLYMAGVGGAFGSREDCNVQIHRRHPRRHLGQRAHAPAVRRRCVRVVVPGGDRQCIDLCRRTVPGSERFHRGNVRVHE